MPSISDTYSIYQEVPEEDILFNVIINNGDLPTNSASLSPIYPTLTQTTSSHFSSTIIFSNTTFATTSTNVQPEDTLTQSSFDLSQSSPTNLPSSTLITAN